MADPKHIAIILDGNRRFAKSLMVKPWKGHELGVEKVRKLLQWCPELGINELTLYAFSVDNFHRDKGELDFLMKLMKQSFDRLRNDREIHDRRLRINFLGRIEMLPPEVTKSMKELMEATKDYDQYVLNFCMAYGGRQEIVDAARKLIEDLEEGKIKKSDINEETFKKYLYTPDEPDIIIRTGGEKRTSNFMVYQSIYSEWFYLDKMWPEFEKQDLIDCIEGFRKRERRFGR